EVYDADPPYTPKGSMSQAWSVGAVLAICGMVGKYGAERSAAAPAKKSSAKRTTVKKSESAAAKKAPAKKSTKTTKK
ncbi:MAG: amylo-alpha-1,6-glucosidase, partial [Alistipes sp.]|nr:amylo-alpha-1,6-glucosidase [Alistipes sp.]